MKRTSLLTAAAALVTLAFAAPAMAAPPPNDNLAGATVIDSLSQPAPMPYDGTGATTQPGEPGIGTKTVWFKWTPNLSGAAIADTCTLADAPAWHYLRVFRVVDGQSLTMGTLLNVVESDTKPLPAGKQCETRFRAAGGTTYYLQVTVGTQPMAGQLEIVQDLQKPAAPVLAPTWPATTGPSFTATWTGPAGVTYLCSLDEKAWKACTSPHQLAGLAHVDHKLAVHAMDDAGNLSPIAERLWDVDAVAPETTITGPTNGTSHARPIVTWTTNEEADSICSLDGGPYEPCLKPYEAPALAPGEHRLRVKAVDILGNTEATPAEVTWIVPAPPVEPVLPVQEPATTPAGTPQPNAVAPPQTPGTTTASARCTVSLSAPRRVKLAKARKGFRVTVAACGAPVVVEQRGRRLVTRRAGAGGSVLLKVKRARRGRIVVSAGGAKRTVRVA